MSSIVSAPMTRELQTAVLNDDNLTVLNGISWVSIFMAIGRSKRNYLIREVLESAGGCAITYTGFRLVPDHLILWEFLIHETDKQQLGSHFEVALDHLLKRCGRDPLVDANREILLGQLATLKATTLEIRLGRYTYSGSLIREINYNNQADHAGIVLNHVLIALVRKLTDAAPNR